MTTPDYGSGRQYNQGGKLIKTLIWVRDFLMFVWGFCQEAAPSISGFLKTAGMFASGSILGAVSHWLTQFSIDALADYKRLVFMLGVVVALSILTGTLGAIKEQEYDDKKALWGFIEGVLVMLLTLSIGYLDAAWGFGGKAFTATVGGFTAIYVSKTIKHLSRGFNLNLGFLNDIIERYYNAE